MAAVLLGAVHRPAPLTVYSAPAGERLAGASPGNPIDAILPDGRISAPVGQTIFVGTNPLGVALSPDGRFAIVSNNEQNATAPSALPRGSSQIAAGYSLAVVDTSTMRVASVYQAPGTTFFCGVAAVADPANPRHTIVLASDGANNAVRIFDLASNGTLAPEAQTIAMAAPRAYPGAVTVSGNGRTAYVVDNLGGTVSAIDLASRRLLNTTNVGFFPAAAAVAGSRLFVTNEGLAQYRTLPQAGTVPQFGTPPAEPFKSSSLSVVDLAENGDLPSNPNGDAIVRMDPVPDGVQTVGGAKPGAVVVRRDAEYAYVAMSNVDRIATVALGPSPHVVAGLDLRLFVNAPYGTQPSAEVLSRDGQRLYVALAGLNAVAVLDARNPSQIHRLGLIPTGWYPSALALSPDNRYLYVTDARGVDGWGMLQRVDMKKLPLVKVTLSALRYNRSVSVAHPSPVVPALRSNQHSSAIDRVVYISVGTDSFDAMLGDLGHGNGQASFAQYGAGVTPNLHALAKTYGLADNFYVNDMNPDVNMQFALAGAPTLYGQQTLRVNSGRAPLDLHGQDPEDYTRVGYLFNAVSRARLSYRDYGGLLGLSGYEPATPSVTGTRGRPTPLPLPPLGGLYTLDVPGLAALGGHVDLNYAGWNPAISDAKRAAEFVSDMGHLTQAGSEPSFTYVWLPTAPGAAGVADADRALGTIVEFLSQTPRWSSTAVFIVPDGIAGSRDHVNPARSYALVVSPMARAGYVGHAHLSVASVLKTEEELLGLPPLALPDLLSTDMADFFGAAPNPSPYHAIQ